MRRFFKEVAYLKKKNYLRKYLDFKISKTKPITKEPSLVRSIMLDRHMSLEMILLLERSGTQIAFVWSLIVVD